MAKIIAICNQKGGVGKTTTTVSIGAGLARRGKRVLLVDADPQGDLTESLGFKNQDNIEVTLSTLLGRQLSDPDNVNIKDGILHYGTAGEELDLMPSNIELSAFEMALVTALSRETTLKNLLNNVKHDYDYILIDCMPSLGMMTINALTAASSVIIPVQAQFLPAKGMTQLLQTVKRVKRNINPTLKIEGIVLTLLDLRTNLSKEVVTFIRENYGNNIKVFNSIIPTGVRAAEAAAAGKSIFAYDPEGKVANAYKNLIKEVMKNDTELQL